MPVHSTHTRVNQSRSSLSAASSLRWTEASERQIATMSAHDTCDIGEWVDVGDANGVDTAPLSTEYETHDNGVDTAPPSIDDKAYDRFVRDISHPAPVFKVAGVCYILRFPNTFCAEAKTAARTHFHCNACTHRASIYVRDLGPDGPVFFHGLKCGAVGPCEAVAKLRCVAEKTCAQEAKPEPVVVKAETYAPAEEGRNSSTGEPYFHWTCAPAELTAPTVAAKFEKLWRYYGQMDTRLAKLTAPEAVESVRIMLEEQPALERPGHYSSVLDWVSKLQAACAQLSSGGGSFQAMRACDQARIRVLAIMCGRVDGLTHLDFHQADNVVDFCTMPSRDALRAEMDRRSDPAYYMVSQLNRRLAAEGVTSKWLIGLTWNGQYTDDLDIHVTTPNGRVIYYGNKAADGCKLDFDANVSKGEADPCENVSCKPGRFRVQVDNYTRRTFDRPVPFQIVCRQQGAEDVVYDGVWGVNRKKGAMIDVCTHEFTDVDAKVPVMSANAAARAKALDAEWMARVGDPKATIATAESLVGHEGVEVVFCGTGRAAATTTEPSQVGRAFMDMALASTNTAQAAGDAKKKRFLSEACRQQPSTFAEVVAHLKANPATTLSIHPRDHAPGYLVSITTKSAGVRKGELPAPCHFHEKHAYPVKPVAGTIGNARFDATWLESKDAGGLVRVRALVDGVAGGCPFLAIEGASLPTGGGEAFPLASGFYASDLSAEFHAHRERWAFCHTQLKPSKPAARGAEVPLVGAFVTGETAVVYLNGTKVTIRR